LLLSGYFVAAGPIGLSRMGYFSGIMARFNLAEG